MWFLQLQDGIREKLAKTFLSVEQWNHIFDKYRFCCVTAMNLLNGTGIDLLPNYLDPKSILDEDWRNARSIFDIATDTEIKQIESAVLDKKEDGTLESSVKENDHTHRRGLITLIACQKYD